MPGDLAAGAHSALQQEGRSDGRDVHRPQRQLCGGVRRADARAGDEGPDQQDISREFAPLQDEGEYGRALRLM